MTDLLPCPFCNGVAELHSRANRSRGLCQNDVAHWVSCTGDDCCASMGMYDNEAAAIRAWNTRAPADGWQGIETCLNLTTSHPPVDLWSAQGFRICDCQIDVVVYGAVGEPDRYGWTDANGHGSIEEYGPFTHWRSRPAPPTERQQ